MYNQNTLVVAHLNIYSLRSKFELFIKKQKEMLNFLLISEIKIDESLPDSHFKIDGFHNVYQVDRNEKGSGITMLFREDLPVKVLSADKGRVRMLRWYLRKQNG